MALLLNLGVAGVYAQETVNMTFSGTEGASAINLNIDGTKTAEFDFAGNGALGPFTFRNVEADQEPLRPQPSSLCPADQLYTPTAAGAGVFRFHDGSLLNVKLTEGFDCIDFVALQAHCTRVFQITGGSGRFKDASGMLKLTETAVPVSFDDSTNPPTPVFFTATGKFKGTISGVASEEEQEHDERQ
jgi:hypothetical protein